MKPIQALIDAAKAYAFNAPHDRNVCCCRENLDNAIAAVEEFIKPVKLESVDMIINGCAHSGWRCPNCKAELNIRENNSNYCSNCGKPFWSDK